MVTDSRPIKSFGHSLYPKSRRLQSHYNHPVLVHHSSVPVVTVVRHPSRRNREDSIIDGEGKSNRFITSPSLTPFGPQSHHHHIYHHQPHPPKAQLYNKNRSTNF
jgi:hypothetical protein